jgi:hypothetical protein
MQRYLYRVLRGNLEGGDLRLLLSSTITVAGLPSRKQVPSTPAVGGQCPRSRFGLQVLRQRPARNIPLLPRIHSKNRFDSSRLKTTPWYVQSVLDKPLFPRSGNLMRVLFFSIGTLTS